MTTLLESLQALVAKWRGITSPQRAGIHWCADELSALIAQHQSPEQAARERLIERVIEAARRWRVLDTSVNQCALENAVEALNRAERDAAEKGSRDD